jgi:hypothetical protein
MLPYVHVTRFFNEHRTEYCRSGAVSRLLHGSVAQSGCVGSVSGFHVQLDTLYTGCRHICAYYACCVESILSSLHEQYYTTVTCVTGN